MEQVIRGLVGLGLLALVACASVDSRIAKNQELFDGYPPEVQANIRAGKIALGYTPEMVRMALGEPDRRTQLTSEASVAEVWTYRKTTPGIGFGLGTGSYGSHTGVGTGVAVSRGSRSEDEMVIEFRGGVVSAFDVAIEE